MPQLFAIAALAAGGYILARVLRREMSRVEAKLSKAARQSMKEEAVATLKRDPESGRYRPEGG